MIDRELRSNFPVQLSRINGDPVQWGGFTPGIIDTDQDGEKELAFTLGDYAAIMRLDGSLKYSEQKIGNIFSNGPLVSPAIGDVNQNGKLEIFYPGLDSDWHLEFPDLYSESTPISFCLTMFLPNLSLYPGWPQKCPMTSSFFDKGGYRPWASLYGGVLADLD